MFRHLYHLGYITLLAFVFINFRYTHSLIPNSQSSLKSNKPVSDLKREDTRRQVFPQILNLVLPIIVLNHVESAKAVNDPAVSKNEILVQSTPNAFQESISGLVAGAALTTTKTIVKYPLDTITVRLQMPPDENVTGSLWDGLYTGILNPLLVNIPAGAIFFAVKDAVKSSLRQEGLTKPVATLLAVLIANFPYWVIRNPSEVIKTKQQAAAVIKTYETSYGTSILRALQEEKENGISGLYLGYWENILYAYPADALKFLIYDQLMGIGSNDDFFLSASLHDAAIAGAVATATAQFVTTPLDIVRNRVMTNTTESKVFFWRTLEDLAANEGGISAWFKGAIPRVLKALLSGAIQFVTYEEIKQQILNILGSYNPS